MWPPTGCEPKGLWRLPLRSNLSGTPPTPPGLPRGVPFQRFLLLIDERIHVQSVRRGQEEASAARLKAGKGSYRSILRKPLITFFLLVSGTGSFGSLLPWLNETRLFPECGPKERSATAVALARSTVHKAHSESMCAWGSGCVEGAALPNWVVGALTIANLASFFPCS